MRRLVLLALLTLGVGCSYKELRIGDDRFLRSELSLVQGVTTLMDVTRELGPPDLLWIMDDDTLMLYAFQERVTQSIILRYFAANLVQGSREVGVKQSLILVFDRTGKLRVASSQESQNGGSE